MCNKNKSIFVTVGTTEFQKLIDKISQDAILQLLYERGYDSIQLQTGRGRSVEKEYPNVKLTSSPFFEDFSSEIDKSSLVISHAGAGSCLEVLRRNKPLIIVVNEDLMDNHQIELAEHLQHLTYAYYCNVDTLENVIKKDMTILKAYPVPDKQLFSRYLNTCMGFSEDNKPLASLVAFIMIISSIRYTRDNLL